MSSDVGFDPRTAIEDRGLDGDGAEAWQRALAASGLPPLRSRRHVSDDFRASLAVHDVRPLRLVDLVTPPGQCFRDARSVRDADDGMCQIEVVAEGRVLAEQDGSQAELGPADLVVIDPGPAGAVHQHRDDQCHHDGAATAAGIAAAHRVSVRTLYSLFAEVGSPVSAYIRQRRLSRSYHDVLHGDGESMGVIARRWGFANAAQFSRLFRERYGIPPSHLRGQHR